MSEKELPFFPKIIFFDNFKPQKFTMMNKCYFLLILFSFGYSTFAQVGINTTNPKSSLHVQKKEDLNFPDGIIIPEISGDSLALKDAAYGPAQNGAILFVTSPTTSKSMKTQGVSESGFFVYDANYTNSDNTKGVWNHVQVEDPALNDSFYAARGKGDLHFLDLGIDLFGSRVKTIPIHSQTTENFIVEIPSAQVKFDSITKDGYYTVPADGIYDINYSFRIGQGISAEILSQDRPGIVITKAGSGTITQTALDYRLFGGVELLNLGALGVANISLTQGQISHIYKLKKGDQLRFGIIQGGINLNALHDTSAEISIYKER